METVRQAIRHDSREDVGRERFRYVLERCAQTERRDMRSHFRLVLLRIGLACSFLTGASVQALAQRPDSPPIDLTDLTLEELLRINVTTASKKTESLSDAPAIMVVLTERDIQSYGSRSLVEVLDRTTSIFVMGTQENLQGALTMRGDATLGANNHILVLLNGRPIQESTVWRDDSSVLTRLSAGGGQAD